MTEAQLTVCIGLPLCFLLIWFSWQIANHRMPYQQEKPPAEEVERAKTHRTKAFEDGTWRDL